MKMATEKRKSDIIREIYPAKVFPVIDEETSNFDTFSDFSDNIQAKFEFNARNKRIMQTDTRVKEEQKHEESGSEHTYDSFEQL